MTAITDAQPASPWSDPAQSGTFPVSDGEDIDLTRADLEDDEDAKEVA